MIKGPFKPILFKTQTQTETMSQSKGTAFLFWPSAVVNGGTEMEMGGNKKQLRTK